MRTKTVGGYLSAALTAMTFSVSATQAAEPGPTVQTILDRGELLCTGHNGSFLGFAEVDDSGGWKGFDIELCKAMATMLLGSPEKVKIIPVSWAQRFPALQSGDIDVIIKVTGWTMGRDTEVGLQFSRPYFLGNTQFIARKEIGAETALDLEGATVCTTVGTSTERLMVDYLENIGIEYSTITFEKSEELREAYFSGRCDVYAGWGPNLAITRAQAENPEEHEILPDILAVEPESIAMRQGDDNFVDVANWMMSALLTAEEQGVTSANVDEMKASPPNPVVQRLLGATPGIGERLGLSDDWAYNMIKAVGNYGEIYNRTLGDQGYGMPRGANALVRDGGVLYPLILD